MPKTYLGHKSSMRTESTMPKVNFKVNKYAVLLSSIASELRARYEVKKRPERKEALVRNGLLNEKWSARINEFAKANRADFVTSKIFSRADILDTLVPFAPMVGTEEFDRAARSRLEYEYQLSEEEIEAAMRIFSKAKLDELANSSEFTDILIRTNEYRRRTELDWQRDLNMNLETVYSVIGESEIAEEMNRRKNGSDSLTVLVMPPHARVQRVANKTAKEVVFCLSIPGEHSAHKKAYTNGVILDAYMQDVVFPYETSMTAKEKQQKSAYIRYISDKNIGTSTIRNSSIFDFQTPYENLDMMGKMYPAYLGYKYRKAPMSVAVPAIQAEISRDMAGFSRLPNEEVKSRMSSFKLGELDPNAIAGLFKGRYVTPQTFAKLDLDSIGERVYINPTIRKQTEREERIR